jgi:hypothetical protein
MSWQWNNFYYYVTFSILLIQNLQQNCVYGRLDDDTGLLDADAGSSDIDLD